MAAKKAPQPLKMGNISTQDIYVGPTNCAGESQPMDERYFSKTMQVSSHGPLNECSWRMASARA
jgi:hypothetical protein